MPNDESNPNVVVLSFDTFSPETDKILSTGVRIVFNDAMTESYAASLAEGIRKVAEHYAA